MPYRVMSWAEVVYLVKDNMLYYICTSHTLFRSWCPVLRLCVLTLRGRTFEARPGRLRLIVGDAQRCISRMKAPFPQKLRRAWPSTCITSHVRSVPVSKLRNRDCLKQGGRASCLPAGTHHTTVLRSLQTITHAACDRRSKHLAASLHFLRQTVGIDHAGALQRRSNRRGFRNICLNRDLLTEFQ